MKKNSYVLISGGTGGHVIPAVNFGNYIIENGHSCYLFVDNRGKKYASHFRGQIIVINSAHLAYNFFGKLKSLYLLLYGLIQSTFYLIQIRPSKCLSFGSYASFMPLIILTIFNFFGLTQIYLHEQNSVMGKVNIFFSRISKKIFLGFETTTKLKKKYKNKSCFVGLPKDHSYTYNLRKKNIDKNKKIFVCGGSQGAVNLNYEIKKLLIKINEHSFDKLEISMQCPNSQIKEFSEIFENLQIKYDLRNFYDNILEKLYQTDILIARSGAGTINDVIFTQIPTIFIPLPSSANNHQFYNARYLQDKKAALIINESEISNHKSYLVIKKLIEDINQQKSIIKNLQKIKNFDTNSLIYKQMNLI